MSGTWMVVGWAVMLVFWAGVIGLGVWAFLKLTGNSKKSERAISIASERYARGEISKEEFDRIKKDLP